MSSFVIDFCGCTAGQKKFFACQVILVSAKVSSRSEVEQVYYQDTDVKFFFAKSYDNQDFPARTAY